MFGLRGPCTLEILWVCLIVILIFPAGLNAAPVTFNSAMPVAEDDAVFRLKTTTLRSSDDPSPLNRDLTVQATAFIGAYGWNSDLALIGVAPYLDKEQARSTWSSPRGDVGLGDIRGFARYTIYRDNYRRGQTAIAPFAGMETPTGEHEKSGLPRPLQLGSGSWDPFGGMVFQQAGLYKSHYATVSYQNNTEADGFEFGNEFRINYAFQRYLLKRNPDNGPSSVLYGQFEVNYLDQDNHELNGIENPNTGGSTLYFTPSFQLISRRWVIESALQIPVEQNLNGNALKADYTFTLGGRVNF